MDTEKKGFLAMLKRPSAKYSLLSILVVGFFGGIFFWGGFNTAMEATNTLEFCIGCHEMRDNVYQSNTRRPSITATAPACAPSVPTAMCRRTGRTR
jgi:nitrate/TMAO reductase-like tetraheme cytochrome c subunit